MRWPPPSTSPPRLPAFLRGGPGRLRGAGGELVLFEARTDGASLHRQPVGAGYAVCVERHELAEAGRQSAARSRALRRRRRYDGWVRSCAGAPSTPACLAAPLRTRRTARSACCSSTTAIGMEGFERGELRSPTRWLASSSASSSASTLLQAIDEERRKLADILENTSDGIFTIDADGTITSWNAGLAGDHRLRRRRDGRHPSLRPAAPARPAAVATCCSSAGPS